MDLKVEEGNGILGDVTRILSLICSLEDGVFVELLGEEERFGVVLERFDEIWGLAGDRCDQASTITQIQIDILWSFSNLIITATPPLLTLATSSNLLVSTIFNLDLQSAFSASLKREVSHLII